ncbi:MAG: formate dehydrogenase accessory sulfurtransferase FdhD [Chloroflexi bacterium]|nr:formate dehydrogenase accessory sulfurtransferase FdhD [Chloroflexota bacterium]
MERLGSTVPVTISRVQDGFLTAKADVLATEEPLEIRLELRAGNLAVSRSIAVTMRTPGNDFELAAGFLFTEGIVREPEAIASLTYCVDGKEEQQYNVVKVTLRPWVRVELERLQRNFAITSSCGVCGKAKLEAVRVHLPQPPGGQGLRVSARVIAALPDALREQQALFQRTGGLHAAWLCDPDGALRSAREDVGRHNALDKLLGEQFLARRIPLANKVLVLSGRASFEMVQKAAMAGVPVVVAVGAPSSLAVDLARELGMTLVGFTRKESFNIYSGMERVRIPSQHGSRQQETPEKETARCPQ